LANCHVRCWQGCGSADTGYTVHRLPSGREVKVLGVTEMFFSKGDPALMLKYRTDLCDAGNGGARQAPRM